VVSVGELAVVVLAAGGVFFAFVAAVGLLRLPDLYTRAHAASKSDTLGAVLSLAAVALVFGTDITTMKAAFLVAFMFVTNPTAAHAIARAAHDQGIEPWTVADRETEVGPAAGGESAEGTVSEPATDGGTSGEDASLAATAPDTEASESTRTGGTTSDRKGTDSGTADRATSDGEPTDSEAAAGTDPDSDGHRDRTGGEGK
jgi:multicomponent Na+:H+ antiporter subunit G